MLLNLASLTLFHEKAWQEDSFFQKKSGEEVAGFFDPAAGRIGLTKNANLSTFTHEWGHWAAMRALVWCHLLIC